MAAASRGLSAAARLSHSAAEPSQAVMTQVRCAVVHCRRRALEAPCDAVKYQDNSSGIACRAFATVPEFFGKESKYTAGSGFLGVPENSRDVRLL